MTKCLFDYLSVYVTDWKKPRVPFVCHGAATIIWSWSSSQISFSSTITQKPQNCFILILRFITRLEPFSLPNMEYGLPARLPSLKHIVGLEEKAVGAMKIRFTAIIPNHTVPKQESRYINEVFQYIHRIWFHFGGESGIPVPGKPELVPNSGEVGSTNDPWPAVVGDSGMPERDVGKADRVGDDISGLIPACIQND